MVMLTQYMMFYPLLSVAFKLVNEIDVETTRAAIEKFAAENRDLIKINADRLASLSYPYRSSME
jgi:hypothetical protein